MGDRIRLWERSHDYTIVQLPDITPQLWHDVTPQQGLKCKEMDGGTNMMITYDVTPQQRLNPSAKIYGGTNMMITYDETKNG